MKRYLLIAAIFTFLFPAGALAETPEQKGLAIAMEDDKRDNGFGDFTANMVMALKN